MSVCMCATLCACVGAPVACDSHEFRGQAPVDVSQLNIRWAQRLLVMVARGKGVVARSSTL